MTISFKKVGGLRFLRLGRLTMSWCITRKPVRAWQVPRNPLAQLQLREEIMHDARRPVMLPERPL